MGLINGEPDCGSEGCVTTLFNGTEEGNIEAEEENPEVIINTPVQPEVSVWGLCIRQKHFMRPGASPTKKTEILQIHFNYPYVHTLHFTVHYPDQPLHSIYILTIDFCVITLQDLKLLHLDMSP